MQKRLESIEHPPVTQHPFILVMHKDIEVVECTHKLVTTVKVVGDHVLEVTFDVRPLRQMTGQGDISVVV